ncbi:pyrroline-5-carboxylate reductase [Corynebacterium atypicum]|uniref:Pyrroline-5-carboxylate reductase n=1 Tax=Corynebacterium atypicum TaxID=191610 RepID=A0ABM5QLD7_9CORY|nr:pyrroline-5-carboxylate reductase [Corynebacterium atypicum]AIG63590.1 pyrroline-5-carboxylate reductase [Corynebacterium atypicum]
MTSIAVIGGGQIGQALISGLIASGTDPNQITVTNRRAEHAEELAARFNVNALTDNLEAVTGADAVFLCVHPGQIVEVSQQIAETVSDNEPSSIVVSMAAGISLDAMQQALGAGTPAVRAMPNTPMTVGKGVSAIAPGRYVDADQMALVREILECTGRVVEVQESDLDAVTALAGSAPGYFFLLTEALIDAGVALGLSRPVATELAKGAANGAGAMMAEDDVTPASLRAGICSPGGTTAAAVRSLEESGIRGALYRATEACARRSAELGAPVQEEKSDS